MESKGPGFFRGSTEVYITPNGSDETKLLETKFAKRLGLVRRLQDFKRFLNGMTLKESVVLFGCVF